MIDLWEFLTPALRIVAVVIALLYILAGARHLRAGEATTVLRPARHSGPAQVRVVTYRGKGARYQAFKEIGIGLVILLLLGLNWRFS